MMTRSGARWKGTLSLTRPATRSPISAPFRASRGFGPLLRSSTVPDSWANFGVDLHLDVDTGGGGRRQAVERALREAIRSGRLAPQTRLPSTRALAAELGLARNTVAAAYDQLIAEGFLTARTGSGTTVVPDCRNLRRAGTLRAPRPRTPLRPAAGQPGRGHVPGRRRGYGPPAARSRRRSGLGVRLRRPAGPARVAPRAGRVPGPCPRGAGDAGADRDHAPGTSKRSRCWPVSSPGTARHRDGGPRAGLPPRRRPPRRRRVLALPVDDARRPYRPFGRTAPTRAAVLTPAHQYPTGVTLHPGPAARRGRLGPRRRRPLIEDDYDGEFRYDRQPVGALQGMAPDHVAYVGTAAKTLGPALRLGWLVAARPARRAGDRRRNGSPTCTPRSSGSSPSPS